MNLDEITHRAAEQTVSISQALFDAGLPVTSPAYELIGRGTGLFPTPICRLALPDGLYVMRQNENMVMFLVKRQGESSVRGFQIKADINGKLYSNWYSELHEHYDPIPRLRETGTELRRCSDSAWQEVLQEHKADNQAMEDRWANS